MCSCSCLASRSASIRSEVILKHFELVSLCPLSKTCVRVAGHIKRLGTFMAAWPLLFARLSCFPCAYTWPWGWRGVRLARPLPEAHSLSHGAVCRSFLLTALSGTGVTHRSRPCDSPSRAALQLLVLLACPAGSGRGGSPGPALWPPTARA